MAVETASPRGFFVIVPHYQPNTVTAHQDRVSLALLTKQGRILGYLGQDARDSGRGPVFIQDDVIEYKTPHDALAQYHRGVAGDARFQYSPGYRRYSVPGRATMLVSFHCLCTLYPETIDVLDSHKGDYYFWVEVHFVTGAASLQRMTNLVEHFASVMKNRISNGTIPVPNSIPQAMVPNPGPTPTPQPILQPASHASLLEEAEQPGQPWTGLPPGTRLGHMHLQVGDIGRAERFYHDILGFDVMATMPTALFLSAGGYHHHLGANVWHSQGASAAPSDSVRLHFFTINLPSEDALRAVLGRLETAGVPFEQRDGSVILQDPWANTVLLHVGGADTGAARTLLKAWTA